MWHVEGLFLISVVIFKPLFSDNPNYSKQLIEKTQERWVASWLYLKYLASLEEFQSTDPQISNLIDFGENVLSSISRNPKYKNLAKEIIEFIQEWEK